MTKKTKSEEILELLDEDDIFEMATLDDSDHHFGVDVKLNILQPGDKKLPHGPRVKVLSHDGKEFYVHLNADASKMTVEGTAFLRGKDLRTVINKIKKYRNSFLVFWHDPNMAVGDLRRLMDKIDSEEPPVTKKSKAEEALDLVDEDELFGMGSIRKTTTGLPVVIWSGPAPKTARKGLRIKVSNLYGNRFDQDQTFSLYFDGEEVKQEGDVGEVSKDVNLVKSYFRKHRAIFQLQWDKKIGDDELKRLLARAGKND